MSILLPSVHMEKGVLPEFRLWRLELTVLTATVSCMSIVRTDEQGTKRKHPSKNESVFIFLRDGQTETILTGVDQNNADKLRAKWMPRNRVFFPANSFHRYNPIRNPGHKQGVETKSQSNPFDAIKG